MALPGACRGVRSRCPRVLVPDEIGAVLRERDDVGPAVVVHVEDGKVIAGAKVGREDVLFEGQRRGGRFVSMVLPRDRKQRWVKLNKRVIDGAVFGMAGIASLGARKGLALGIVERPASALLRLHLD